MNPATQALMRQIRDEELGAFVETWDALEGLSVAIYRGGRADAQQAEEFIEIRSALQEHYPQWQTELDAHWRATKINGQPVSIDPFLTLIGLPDADAIVDNWTAMQILPAAREALNGMLVLRIESGE